MNGLLLLVLALQSMSHVDTLEKLNILSHQYLVNYLNSFLLNFPKYVCILVLLSTLLVDYLSKYATAGYIQKASKITMSKNGEKFKGNNHKVND